MKSIFVLLLLLVTRISFAQNVEGYWYGNANAALTDKSNNYLFEIILKQNGGNVQGVISYYFKNTFRSFKVNGSFNPNSRMIQLFAIPVTYHGSTEKMAVDCMMDFTASLRVAKAGSNLSGRFVSRPEYRVTCPEIVFDMKLNRDATNQDSILTALRQFKETYQVWTPAAEDTAVAVTIQQRPIVNYVVNNQYKERENVVAQEIEVDGDSVLVDFYDNGEVDGDSISVFYNSKLMASSQKLSAKAVQIKVGLDPLKEVNEISMFADNMGSIPPNTALMIVYDGKKRYEVRLTSNLKANATVRLRRKTAAGTNH